MKLSSSVAACMVVISSIQPVSALDFLLVDRSVTAADCTSALENGKMIPARPGSDGENPEVLVFYGGAFFIYEFLKNGVMQCQKGALIPRPAEEPQPMPAPERDSLPLTAPKGLPMTSSEKDGMRSAINSCWNIGSLSSAAQRVKLVMRVEMNEDGTPIGSSIEMTGYEGGDDAAAQQAFEAAKRAVVRGVRGCGGGGGYRIGGAKDDGLNTVYLVFDSSGLRLSDD